MDRDANLTVWEIKDSQVLISLHKEAHPSDSEDNEDIGDSSEDEAEEMEESPFIRRRKLMQATPAPAPPVPAPPPEPPTPGPQPPVPEPPVPEPPAPEPAPLPENKVMVDKDVLSSLLNQLEGQSSLVRQLMEGEEVDPSNLRRAFPPAPRRPTGDGPTEEDPYGHIKVVKGDTVCQVCAKKCHNTSKLRAHMRSHTGKQKRACPKCGRKLQGLHSYKEHVSTCQVEKTHQCPYMFPPEEDEDEEEEQAPKQCPKKFASEKLMKEHLGLHTTIKKTCVCGNKKVYHQLKYFQDHWKTCDSNPKKVGPFPCPVPECPRGEKKFRRFRSMTNHLTSVHKYDPKHLPKPPTPAPAPNGGGDPVPPAPPAPNPGDPVPPAPPAPNPGDPVPPAPPAPNPGDPVPPAPAPNGGGDPVPPAPAPNGGGDPVPPAPNGGDPQPPAPNNGADPANPNGGGGE